MLIIGCDYHPSWQQVCWLDTETGETQERRAESRASDERAVPVAEAERGAKEIPQGLKALVWPGVYVGAKAPTPETA
jgi:hypothetical protein